MDHLEDQVYHPGGNPGANLKSIYHRCYLREEAFEWQLTETNLFALGSSPGWKFRYRANKLHTGQSKPDSDPGFQVKSSKRRTM